ncbi:GMC oxidoreductase [Alloyangia pacifica]|uniref:Choline dehydrogenase n=1 Tax=Alloyangia pacifica TaxID=311180 RepID=A0A1I6WEA5_9RHOB|nr:GMC oxidoreductase [Alloyangia pacifica]SDI62220.1 Choline dehydrogenase [Alloyangia pacifica]SFT24310.1 Choline dehydrogenase [Alloyangia pacifica]
MARIGPETALLTTYDVLVVGAGAAGLALADAANSAGRKVLLLDRGGLSAATPSLEPELPDGSPHDLPHKTNRYGLGGTLAIWGGRCVPFDEADFESRACIASGWPISYSEYAAWLPAASTMLGVEASYQRPAPLAWPKSPGVCMDSVELLCRDWIPACMTRRLLRDTGPDILLDTEITGLLWSARRISGVVSRSDGVTRHLRANEVVLACGGLETTRLLLEEERRAPGRLGGTDWLGRGYMGHLTGSIAEITFNSSTAVSEFVYKHRRGNSPARRRFLVTPPDSPHVAFWIESIAPEDARHGSADLSLKAMLRGAPKGTRLRHVRNVLGNPGDALAGVGAALIHNLEQSKRHPDRLSPRRRGPYRLAYHAEHLPNVESHVTLSSRVDAAGRHPLRISFSYDEATLRGTLAAHRLLAAALDEAQFAELTLDEEDEEAMKKIQAMARDGYHQIGLTRMANSPLNGVVDPNCRVFGTENLHIAAASVFPVSGQANPTLSVVALALRLAAHLSNQKRWTQGGSAAA